MNSVYILKRLLEVTNSTKPSTKPCNSKSQGTRCMFDLQKFDLCYTSQQADRQIKELDKRHLSAPPEM